MHKDLKDFIVKHKLNVKEIKAALRDAKSRLQRLQSNEKRLDDAITNMTHTTHRSKPGSSMMKMPRIALPSFQGGDDGTISWEVFRNMVNRIADTMNASEKIYFLKANLSEEPKRLISLEEEFEVSLAMLDSVYGNETKDLQIKIQNFINIVHEDPNEKIALHTTETSGTGSSYSTISCHQN